MVLTMYNSSSLRFFCLWRVESIYTIDVVPMGERNGHTTVQEGVRDDVLAMYIL